MFHSTEQSRKCTFFLRYLDHNRFSINIIIISKCKSNTKVAILFKNLRNCSMYFIKLFRTKHILTLLLGIPQKQALIF